MLHTKEEKKEEYERLGKVGIGKHIYSYYKQFAVFVENPKDRDAVGSSSIEDRDYRLADSIF